MHELETLYGLSRNPFGLGIPPKYGDEGWCFVDLELKNGMTLSQRIDSLVRRVVNRDPGRRGLIIVGHWGSGKTHAMREFLGRLESANVHCQEVAGAVKGRGSRVLEEIFGTSDVDQIASSLSSNDRAIGIDEAQYFDQRKEDFLELMSDLMRVVVSLAETRARSVIVVCITPGPFKHLEVNRPDIVDRFEVLELKEDLSEDEARQLIKEYLRTARKANWVEVLCDEAKKAIKHLSGGGLDLWPFTVGAVRELLEVWEVKSMGLKRLRTFLDMCREILEYAARHRILEILPHHVEECFNKHYGIWEECLSEWRKSGVEKHKILVYGIYHALDMAIKCDPDLQLRVKDVFPEMLIEDVKPDLMVEVEDGYAVVEVETGPPKPKRYNKLKKLIKGESASRLVIICVGPEAARAAKRVAYKALQGVDYRIVTLEDSSRNATKSVLTLGRLVAFASKDYKLEFPKDEGLRKKVSEIISGGDAAEALRISGISDALS